MIRTFKLVGVTGFEPAASNSRSWRANRTALHPVTRISRITFILKSSGYQDSNLGPPAPKAGALTGLRYTPQTSVGRIFRFRVAKIYLFFFAANFLTINIRHAAAIALFLKFLRETTQPACQEHRHIHTERYSQTIPPPWYRRPAAAP